MLRVEVARDRIKVVLIEPGGFRTGIWQEASHEIERRPGSRYRKAYERVESGLRLGERLMGAPSTVATAIGRAMASTRPRSRYLVGRDAQAIALWSRIAPTEVKDWLASFSLGL